MAYDDAIRRILLITGRGCAGGASGATWSWDGSSWTRLQPSVSPLPGDGGSLAYHDQGLSLVLLAPQPGNGCGLLTWTFDGSTWVPHGGAGAPQGPAMVVRDPASRKPLVVGSNGATWRWNGSAWSVVAGAAGAAACGTRAP
jgi:hypothetical protein